MELFGKLYRKETEKMKRLTAMLLGLALLCCAALAGAEEAAELPYLETEDQDV